MTVNPYPASAREAIRYQTAGLLQHTYRWVRAASEVTPAVTRAAPALTVAVQLYNAEQYPAALRQLSGVVAMLHQARQAYPALPPL
ncbi:MAG TPA: hypothetical protein VFE59_36555 [Trebonia sp.]|jgi:hypothetical protein|nr:hypothetical protein [Trebonia sp.]